MKVSLEHPWRQNVQSNYMPTDGSEPVEVAEKDRPIEQTVKLNNMGEVTVVFTNKELKDKQLIQDWGYSTMKIIAIVTEDLTDIERNGTAEVCPSASVFG